MEQISKLVGSPCTHAPALTFLRKPSLSLARARYYATRGQQTRALPFNPAPDVEFVSAYTFHALDRNLQVSTSGFVHTTMPTRRRQHHDVQPVPEGPRPGLHEQPSTQFSKSRARPGSVLTNAQLVDIFAEKLSLTPARKKSLIGNLCFWDSMSVDGIGGMWSLKDDYVSGGRLGRNHTLPDVPNHYIRDWMLEQIDLGENEVEPLSQDDRELARRALLPDLTADQVKEYSNILAKRREDKLRAERAANGIPEADATPEEIRKCALKRAMIRYDLESEKQAEAAIKLEDALEAVDTTVDMTPRVRPGVVRNYDKYKPIRRSVLYPHLPSYATPPCEIGLSLPVQIDRDCDQIRLMIRRFCHFDEDWPRLCYQYSHHDDFGLEVLPSILGVSRQTLAAFVRQKGQDKGEQSKAYQLAWEFFKRRELLGYPLVKDEELLAIRAGRKDARADTSNSGDDEVVEETETVRANSSDRRSSKRKINDEQERSDGGRKKTKTTATPSRRSARLRR
ncbi:hypothetical protein KVR01_010259 [Diaporthe batatas]|uniref:uncharacterized protein n=1 Tax=Diaporthe batatas TaxID=748121 RepID=UPI001D040AB2|nr:uncharacterized protein KVR01_010259 [Diaporthe batatas]KAG8159622.1 hypothetical protein KVR01_010259 [Diaporthe batatas]